MLDGCTKRKGSAERSSIFQLSFPSFYAVLSKDLTTKFYFQDYFYASFLLYHPVFYPCTNICKSPDQRIKNNR